MDFETGRRRNVALVVRLNRVWRRGWSSRFHSADFDMKRISPGASYVRGYQMYVDRKGSDGLIRIELEIHNGQFAGNVVHDPLDAELHTLIGPLP